MSTTDEATRKKRQTSRENHKAISFGFMFHRSSESTFFLVSHRALIGISNSFSPRDMKIKTFDVVGGWRVEEAAKRG
jgi:hypothetical protein